MVTCWGLLAERCRYLLPLLPGAQVSGQRTRYRIRSILSLREPHPPRYPSLVPHPIHETQGTSPGQVFWLLFCKELATGLCSFGIFPEREGGVPSNTFPPPTLLNPVNCTLGLSSWVLPVGYPVRCRLPGLTMYPGRPWTMDGSHTPPAKDTTPHTTQRALRTTHYTLELAACWARAASLWLLSWGLAPLKLLAHLSPSPFPSSPSSSYYSFILPPLPLPLPLPQIHSFPHILSFPSCS